MKRVNWNPLEDVSRIQSFNNEIWLEVQGRFTLDHQYIDSVTREGFKFAWIKRPQLSIWGSKKREVEVKPMY